MLQALREDEFMTEKLVWLGAVWQLVRLVINSNKP